jgi:exosortase/archaeosortase family protein
MLATRFDATTRAALAAAIAAVAALAMLAAVPALELAVFARGGAVLASLFVGVPVIAIENGWLLADPAFPVAVTVACSATDFYVMVGALLAWHAKRRGKGWVLSVAIALVAAFPVTIAINALRVVTVAALHRWVFPADDAAQVPFLHMAAGVAVFLPALIGVNLALEYYANCRRTRC